MSTLRVHGSPSHEKTPLLDRRSTQDSRHAILSQFISESEQNGSSASKLPEGAIEIERANPGVVGQAVKTDSVWAQAWNNLGCVGRFLSIAPLGIPFLFYVAYLSLTGGQNTDQTSTNIAETIARSPRVEESPEIFLKKEEPAKPKPPVFMTVEPISVPASIRAYPADQAKQSERAGLQKEIDSASKTIENFQENLDQVTIQLGHLAERSGLNRHDFNEALMQGKPLEELGIKYYSFFKGKKEVPSDNQKDIEILYARGQELVESKNEAKGTIAEKKAIIQTHFSTLQQLDDVLLDGTPYHLEVEGVKVKTVEFKPIFEGHRDVNTRATQDLVLRLANWATNSDMIELDESDAGFKAQQYLIALAGCQPMTLTRDEKAALKESGHTLQPAKGGREVQLVRTQEGVPMIHSKRVMVLEDKATGQKQHLQWNETINVANGEATRHVTEI